MFAGPSISQNGITEVKVYADSLIGSRRLAFGTANIAFAMILRCDKQRRIATDGRSCIPKMHGIGLYR